MKSIRVGREYFAGVVNVTDPCYDRDTPGRMNVVVKEGVYDCRVWHQKLCNEIDGKVQKVVDRIGIYLNGFIPPQANGKEIGIISVDSGLAGFFVDKPDYTDDEWSEFCHSIFSSRGNKDVWTKNGWFFSSTGFGDGYYPVCAYKQDDEVVAIEIAFCPGAKEE